VDRTERGEKLGFCLTMTVEEHNSNGDMSDQKLITYERRRVYNENPNPLKVVMLFIHFFYLLFHAC
jgi:hypothetical protein